MKTRSEKEDKCYEWAYHSKYYRLIARFHGRREDPVHHEETGESKIYKSFIHQRW